MSNYLNAQDLGKVFACGVGYVRNLAARHGWRRVRVGRAMYYHVDDALDVLELRAKARWERKTRQPGGA